MAFCVIAIHAFLLKNVSNKLIIGAYNTCVSIAVPFFFSSGCLVTRKFTKERDKNLFLLDKQIKSLEVSCVIETINKAKARRNIEKPLILHSDRGSKYVSKEYRR